MTTLTQENRRVTVKVLQETVEDYSGSLQHQSAISVYCNFVSVNQGTCDVLDEVKSTDSSKLCHGTDYPR